MADEVEEELRELDKSFQARVHEAMEKRGGDRALAAQDLGISLQTLKNKIYECPTLRLRWAKDEVEPMDDVDAIARRPISVDEERQALAYDRAGKDFKKDLSLLPLSSKEVDIALQLQQFNRGRFQEILDIANASLGVAIPKLLSRMMEVESRLKGVREVIESFGGEMVEERTFFVEEEKSLSDQYVQTVNLLRQIQQASFESAKTLALIRYKIAGGNNTKRAKPGFQEIGSINA